MNVLWTKQKLVKLQSGNVQASGDNIPVLCCKICGGTDNLKSFNETDKSDVHEEKYFNLINDCFGIKYAVPANAMICTECGRNLQKINKFRVLVHSAFEGHSYSDDSSNQSQIEAKDSIILRLMSCKKNGFSQSQVTVVKNKASINYRQKRGKFTRRVVYTKKYLPCTVCGQKYLMVAPTEGLPDFICSRCKSIKSNCARNKCFLKNKRDATLNANNDLKAKSRLNSIPKKPVQPKNIANVAKNHKKIFQCTQCKNKYSLAQNLAEHMNSTHGCKQTCLCAVCGLELATKRQLDEHISMHTGPFVKCKECEVICKDKQVLHKHTLLHENLKNK